MQRGWFLQYLLFGTSKMFPEFVESLKNITKKLYKDYNNDAR